MNCQLRSCLVIIFAMLFTSASGQGLSDQIDSLNGLDGVYIMGGDPDEFLAERGVLKGDILNLVSKELRTGGLRVLDETDWLMLEDAPVLYIDLSSRKENDLLVYSVRLEVLYLVNPVSRSEMTTNAVVWGNGRFGTADEEISRQIMNELSRLVVQLINDYASSNSKP